MPSIKLISSTIILVGLIIFSFANVAVSQTVQSLSERIGALQSRVYRIEEQLELDRRKWVGYGYYDDSGLTYWSRLDGEKLSIETSRPGVVKFKFARKLDKRPVVIATPSNIWGSIRLENSTVRLVDVDENGFTVETYENFDLRYIKFFFVILRLA